MYNMKTNHIELFVREFSCYCCFVIHHHFVVMKSSSWEQRERSSCLRSIFRVLPFTTWSYQALSSTFSFYLFLSFPLALSSIILFSSLPYTSFPISTTSLLFLSPLSQNRSCNPSSKTCRDLHPNLGERCTWTHVRFERIERENWTLLAEGTEEAGEWVFQSPKILDLHLQKARRKRENESPKNPWSFIIHLIWKLIVGWSS